MKSRRQRCWAIRFLPANKFWRQEFTCHHHEISSLLIAWKYCINNVHWSLAQMWRNNGVVYGVFWVWWWQMIRDMYMVGRYGGRRSQMREHQKLCKLAYALRTVTHIPDPWDLNLYYGISVHIILTEFALFRSCTAGWPTSWFVCKKQVQNPKKIEENKFPFLTSNLLLFSMLECYTVDPAMIPMHIVQEGGAPAQRRIQYDSSSLSHRIPPNSRWANRIIPEWNSISSLLRLAKHRHDHASSIHHYFIILFVYNLVLNPYQELSS